MKNNSSNLNKKTKLIFSGKVFSLWLLSWLCVLGVYNQEQKNIQDLKELLKFVTCSPLKFFMFNHPWFFFSLYCLSFSFLYLGRLVFQVLFWAEGNFIHCHRWHYHSWSQKFLFSSKYNTQINLVKIYHKTRNNKYFKLVKVLISSADLAGRRAEARSAQVRKFNFFLFGVTKFERVSVKLVRASREFYVSSFYAN